MAERKKPVVKKAEKADSPEKRRCGFLITPETDYKLSLYARRHQLDRSTVVGAK